MPQDPTHPPVPTLEASPASHRASWPLHAWILAIFVLLLWILLS
jgi:hypothetical protein